MKLDPTIELIILEAQRDKMYGSIELKLEAGKLVLIKVSETIKPQSERNSRSSEDGR